MKEFKMRIPCEEVSKLVQEKAFSEGFGWRIFSDTAFLYAHYLFFDEEGLITFRRSKEEFLLHSFKEMAWQEYLYGDGWFFKHPYTRDKVYFQSNSDYKIYSLDNGNLITAANWGYKAYIGETWTECDMHGNKLEEDNNMKQFTKDMLQPGKHVIELANGSLYILLADNVMLKTSQKGWVGLNRYDNNLKHNLENAYDAVKVYSIHPRDSSFDIEDNEHLDLVWEREPEIEEITIEDAICEALGRKVKLKQD